MENRLVTDVRTDKRDRHSAIVYTALAWMASRGKHSGASGVLCAPDPRYTGLRPSPVMYYQDFARRPVGVLLRPLICHRSPSSKSCIRHYCFLIYSYCG